MVRRLAFQQASALLFELRTKKAEKTERAVSDHKRHQLSFFYTAYSVKHFFRVEGIVREGNKRPTGLIKALQLTLRSFL